MAEKAELRKAEPSFSVMLTEKLTSVEDALPNDFNKARFVQNALALINDNPALQKYSKAQLMAGLLKASYLGLDAYAKECYLIPYGNQLQFQIDYRGAKKLAKKYSIRRIRDIDAKIVREGDKFEETLDGGKASFIFKPKPFNTGKIVGAFAYALYEDGGMMIDQMSVEDLETTRRHSKAANSMAWKDFTSEMYRKTVLHRLCKHIEIEFDTPQQRQLYEDDVAIATSPKEVAEAEIMENENDEEFVVEEPVDEA